MILAVFLAVYAGMILGGIPGLAIDRTGIAFAGAVVLLAAGEIDSREAWSAIDFPTLGLLLGLMLISAQLRVAGFYTAVTRWLAARHASPRRLLLESMLLVALLSALLTNDVVCLATAPVLADACVRRRLDPVPFLLGLAAATNIGSAATLIGNPQNILVGQALRLDFGSYLLDGVPPALLSVLVAWWILARAYRGRFERLLPSLPCLDRPHLRRQSTKALILLAALTCGFLLLPQPREAQALLAGMLLLWSRRQQTREMLELVDWPLCVLFAGLFIVNHALADAGHTAAALDWCRAHGLSLSDPAALFWAAVIGSNLVSNVPLVVLLLPAAVHPQAGAILALASTFAGNLMLVGSIANLIVVDQADRLGIRPAESNWWRAHLSTGIPITLASLSIAAAWLAIRA
ncbi:MAG: SLC13 family permease [Planctomycetota bacterium]